MASRDKRHSLERLVEIYFKRRHDAQDDEEGRSQDSSSTAGQEINQDSLAQIKGLSERFLPFLPSSGCTTCLVGS